MEIVHRISGGMLTKIIFIARCPAFPENRWGKRAMGTPSAGKTHNLLAKERKMYIMGFENKE